MAHPIFNVTVIAWPGYHDLHFNKYLAYLAQQLPAGAYIDFQLLGQPSASVVGTSTELAHQPSVSGAELLVRPAASQAKALTDWAASAADSFAKTGTPRLAVVFMHGAAFSSARLFQRDSETLAKLAAAAQVIYVVLDPKGSVFLQLNGVPQGYIIEAAVDRLQQTIDVLIDKYRDITKAPLRISDLDRVRCGGPGAAARSTVVSFG